VADKITASGEATVCTSIVVAAKSRFGARKSGSKNLAMRVDLIFSAIHVEPVDRHYAEICQHLARQGTPIGPNDLLIAAHALSWDLTAVTANEREFFRVPGLKTENWLASF
jgi:tRNA(fMet)-specific endonuclease VapC